MNTKALLLLCSLFFLTTVTASEEPNSFKKKLSYFYALCKKKLSRKKQSLSDELSSEYELLDASLSYPSSQEYYSSDSEDDSSDVLPKYRVQPCGDYYNSASSGEYDSEVPVVSDKKDDLYKYHPLVEHEFDQYIGGVVNNSGRLIHGIQKNKLVAGESSTEFSVPESCPIEVENKVGSITVSQSKDGSIRVFQSRFAQKGFETCLEESSVVKARGLGPVLCCSARNAEQFNRVFLDYHIHVPNGRKMQLRTHFNFPINVTSVAACKIEACSLNGPIVLDVWAPCIKAESREGDIFCKRAQSQKERVQNQADELVKIKRRVCAKLVSYWCELTGCSPLPQDIAAYIAQLAVEGCVAEELKYEIELSSGGNIDVVLPPASSGTVDVYPRHIFSTNFPVVSSQRTTKRGKKTTEDTFSTLKDTGSIIKFGKNVVTSNHFVLANSAKEFTGKKITLRKSE